MHLSNGALSPECVAVTWAGAAAGLAVATHSLRSAKVDHSKLVEATQLTAALFAAHMINVPLLPSASTHLIGGALLAWRLGPGLASICMTSILLIQALFLGDGGLAALGANLINMALLPVLIVSLLSGGGQSPGRVFASSWLSVLLAALVIPLQVNMSNVNFAWYMLSAHAIPGVFEAALTVAAVMALTHLSRPSLTMRRATTLSAATIGLLLTMPLSSSMPDGFESAAGHSGNGLLLTEALPDIEAVGAVNLHLHVIQKNLNGTISETLGSDLSVALISAFAAAVTCFISARSVVSRLDRMELSSS